MKPALTSSAPGRSGSGQPLAPRPLPERGVTPLPPGVLGTTQFIAGGGAAGGMTTTAGEGSSLPPPTTVDDDEAGGGSASPPTLVTVAPGLSPPLFERGANFFV